MDILLHISFALNINVDNVKKGGERCRERHSSSSKGRWRRRPATAPKGRGRGDPQQCKPHIKFKKGEDDEDIQDPPEQSQIDRQRTKVLEKRLDVEYSPSLQMKDSLPEQNKIKHLTLEEQSRMLREQVVRDVTSTEEFSLEGFEGVVEEVKKTSQIAKSITPQTSRVEVKEKEPSVLGKPFEFVTPSNLQGEVSASTFVAGGSMKEKKEEDGTPSYWARRQSNNPMVPKAKVGLGLDKIKTKILHSVKLQPDLFLITDHQFEMVQQKHLNKIISVQLVHRVKKIEKMIKGKMVITIYLLKGRIARWMTMQQLLENKRK